jgi:hypothetical protein
MATPQLVPDQIARVSGLASQYISTQREKYAARAITLAQQKATPGPLIWYCLPRLRDEHRELRLFQNVKRSSRRVLIQRRHPVHSQEIVPLPLRSLISALENGTCFDAAARHITEPVRFSRLARPAQKCDAPLESLATSSCEQPESRIHGEQHRQPVDKVVRRPAAP